MRYVHNISPVFASSATTARRVPAIAYTTPLTISGVPSSLLSGRGPRLSVLKRHAISILLKLDALIWSSGEYLLPFKSAVYIGHSPFLVLGIGLAWPDSFGAIDIATTAASTRTGAIRNNFRVMNDSLTG